MVARMLSSLEDFIQDKLILLVVLLMVAMGYLLHCTIGRRNRWLYDTQYRGPT